jgi:predicted DNA-binding protein
MIKNGKDKTISLRLSQAMLEALDARAVLDEKDRTQVIREAIVQYLDLPQDTIEERIDSLERGLEDLYSQRERTAQRVDSLEKRVSELSHLIAICLERFK